MRIYGGDAAIIPVVRGVNGREGFLSDARACESTWEMPPRAIHASMMLCFSLDKAMVL
jgi:hypothetical protein